MNCWKCDAKIEVGAYDVVSTRELCNECKEKETDETCKRQVEDLLGDFSLARILRALREEVLGWAAVAHDEGRPNSAERWGRVADILNEASEESE